jgi:hypothetical protein
MGWQFAARWSDEAEPAWNWLWRRVAADSGAVLEESLLFSSLHECVDDARMNGVDESGCGL